MTRESPAATGVRLSEMYAFRKKSYRASFVLTLAICEMINSSPAIAQAFINPPVGALGSEVLTQSAVFQGGTLKLNIPNYVYPGNFFLNTSGTIDIFGNVSTFSPGVFSGGQLTITNSVGGGSVTFNGSNTYSGGTIFAGGTLFANISAALGTGTLAFTGGTLGYSGGNTTDYSNRFSTTSNSYSIDTGGNNVTFGTTLSSSGASLTKIGSGTLTLSPTGTNSFSSGINLFGGNLQLGNANAIGGASDTSAGLLQFSGGTLQYNTGINLDYSSRFRTGVTQAYSIDTAGQNVDFASVLQGSSSTLTKLGTGTLQLVGGSTYGGATNVSGGTLLAGSANKFAPSSAFTVTSPGILDLNSSNQTIGSLAGTGNTLLGTGILTTGGNNTSTTYSGAMSGTGGLIKTGTGTFTLTGVNTYQGGTEFRDGILNVGSAQTTTSGALGDISAIGRLLNFTGGTLQYSANNQFDYSDRFFETAGQLYRIDTNNQLVTFATPLTSDSGSLTKLGLGTLTLTAQNTYISRPRIISPIFPVQ